MSKNRVLHKFKMSLTRGTIYITPHVFRHTFCTNMANAGMDIKTLQYVMGHSDVGVTLNVYTHASYDRAAEQMARILDFKEADMHGKQRKLG